MTTDYPDYTRLFHLVGTDITIPISIESAAVTLNVKLVSSTALVYVYLTGSLATLDVSITESFVTMDVKITDSTVTMDINFADQSVAVFDAAKWFAHQATQWFVNALANIASGSSVTATRTVPVGKESFVCGLSSGYWVAGAGVNILWALRQDSGLVCGGGFDTGGGMIFDVPVRMTAGHVVNLSVYNYSGATKDTVASVWGYDEDA